MLKVAELLDNYTQSKKKISMLKAELNHIENSPIIKVTRYGGESNGNDSNGIEDVYHNMIERKDKITNSLWAEEDKVIKVDVALKILKEENERDFEILKLRHIDKKSLAYIGDIKGYSRSSVLNKIRYIEKRLKKLLEI